MGEKEKFFFIEKEKLKALFKDHKTGIQAEHLYLIPNIISTYKQKQKTEPSINDNGIDTNLCRVVQSRIDMS